MLREVGRLGSVNMLKLCGCVLLRVFVFIFFAISRATEPCTHSTIDVQVQRLIFEAQQYTKTGKNHYFAIAIAGIHVYSCGTRNRLLSTVKHNIYNHFRVQHKRCAAYCMHIFVVFFSL